MTEEGGRTGGKHAGSRGTAFYIEALLLTAVFVVVILALARVFAWSGQRGRDAALLTGAVHLAENGAEAVAASDSLEEVRGLLEENGNAEIFERSGVGNQEAGGEGARPDAGIRTLRMYYDDDLNPAPEGQVWMDIQWIPEGSGEDSEEASGGAGDGGFVTSIITVETTGRSEPIYTLETGVFTGTE